MTPALHLQEPDRRGDPHGEDGEDQPRDIGFLARPCRAADPQFVVVPEVAGVEHVAPADHQHPVDQGVVGDQVQGPAQAVEHAVDQDQVADQRDDHRPHRQAGAQSLALQPHPAHEDGEADEAGSPHAHQGGADDHPLVGPALSQARLVVVILEADRAVRRRGRLCSRKPVEQTEDSQVPPAPGEGHVQLDEEHRQQVAVDDDLQRR